MVGGVTSALRSSLSAWQRLRQAHGSMEHCHEILGGLHGRVVEIGAVTSTHFRPYPPEATQIDAVKPDRRLRALAERGRTASMRRVCSLVLCTIADVPDEVHHDH